MAICKTAEVKICIADGRTTGRNILLNIICIQIHHNIKMRVLVVDTFHKTAMNYWVPLNVGNFASEELTGFRKRLFTLHLLNNSEQCRSCSNPKQYTVNSADLPCSFDVLRQMPRPSSDVT